MVIRYFAWLRDHTGCAHETITCPADVNDISQLVHYLTTCSEGHRAAFANQETIKVAINQEFASFTAPVSDGDEVAFFPPVTGG